MKTINLILIMISFSLMNYECENSSNPTVADDN